MGWNEYWRLKLEDRMCAIRIRRVGGEIVKERKSWPSTIWEYGFILLYCSYVRGKDSHSRWLCHALDIPNLYRFKSQFFEPIPSVTSEITDITMWFARNWRVRIGSDDIILVSILLCNGFRDGISERVASGMKARVRHVHLWHQKHLCLGESKPT